MNRLLNKGTNISIFLVTGPGHHAHLLIDALENASGGALTYTTYWPKFAQYRKKEGGNVLCHQSFFYQLLHNILWAMAARLPKVLKKQNRHLDWSYALYDRYVKTRYKGENTLWAWTQMSNYTMRKARSKGARVVLEYPMIHCRDWDFIMGNALGAAAYKSANSYFSKSMLQRMDNEIHQAGQINVLSSYAKRTFVKNGLAADRVVLSQLYIDTAYFSPAEHKTISEPLKILFVGRVEVLKGIKILIKALHKIDFAYELHLVGQVYEEIEVDIAGIAQNVIRHGSLSRQQLPAIYAQCDVLVLPSLQESFGLVILEALSCGLPVLASQNTGAPDIVVHKETGYLFDPESIEQLGAGLLFFHKAIKVQKVDFTNRCRTSALEFSSAQKYREQINIILHGNS